ncbi:MAG: hypothetical protein C4318_08750 [Acidimicrobiia bacterium]
MLGEPIARKLADAGTELRVWNRTPAKALHLAEYGAQVAATPATATTEADPYWCT